MDSVAHSDIFFFITSVVVVVIGAVFAVALIYVVRILKDMKQISGEVRTQSGQIAEDITRVRTKVKESSARIKSIIDFFLKKASRGKRSKR